MSTIFQPMPNTARLEFHVCHSDPNSNEVVGFDIYLATEEDQEQMLGIESRFVDEDWNNVPLFTERFIKHGTRLTLRHKKRRLSLPVIGSGSGGNWYWEVYLIPARCWPYLLNWLRRLKGLSRTEWDTEFFNTIWRHRGSIQLTDLKAFARQFVDSNSSS